KTKHINIENFLLNFLFKKDVYMNAYSEQECQTHFLHQRF
ncbi:hypothetical protein TNCT_52321, partial [Trichonephila clavata]